VAHVANSTPQEPFLDFTTLMRPPCSFVPKVRMSVSSFLFGDESKVRHLLLLIPLLQAIGRQAHPSLDIWVGLLCDYMLLSSYHVTTCQSSVGIYQAQAELYVCRFVQVLYFF
jgi:hypothetical protein